MKIRTIPYDVAEQLRTPEDRAAYLDAWLEEAGDDASGIARALEDIARSSLATMSHEGCTARIEFDERDKIFVGRVVNVRPVISFHGDTVAELRGRFETVVEEFLREREKKDSDG